jgi:hypothetical protein
MNMGFERFYARCDEIVTNMFFQLVVVHCRFSSSL